MEKTIRFRFIKKGEQKYLSHLDMINMMVRALRRAKVKMKYSSGFNPRPRISFSPPIPLGIDSLAEYADVTVTDPVKEKEFLVLLNSELGGRMKLIGAIEVPPGTKNLMNQVDIASYLIRVRGRSEEKTVVLDCMKGCLKDLDLEEAVHDMEIIRSIADRGNILIRLHAFVRALAGRNAKVFKVRGFLECLGTALAGRNMGVESIIKEELFILEKNKKLTPFEVL